MASELIPVVDLRLLSQEELNTLSLSAPNAVNLRRCDDVVVPKIDRSVFNESAGSRKQTYSRLRLAPRKPDAPSSSSSSTSVARCRSRSILSVPPSAAPPAGDDPCRRENQKIVSFLRKLFSGEDSSPTPAPAQSPARTLNLEVASKALVLVDVRDKAEASNALVLVEDGDREVLSVKGVAVDLIALGDKEAPFAEELRRRTEGLRTEEELLGFLAGLDGLWGSRRKKRRIVDAAVFGDDLPRGWKLLLGLRRKEGIARLDCRRYVSPNGKQFVSCKDVASYILSLVGHQDARQPFSGQNGSGTPNVDKLTPGYVAGPTHQADALVGNPTCLSVTPLSSVYADHKEQDVLFRVEKQDMIELKNILECHKCSLTFGDKDALMQHLLSFHQSVKRRRLGKSIGDGVIIKDGRYECQFCHKTFSERHRYNGHIGAHVRYQGLSAEALPDVITTGKIINPTPLAAVPFYEMNVLLNKNEEPCTAKSVDSLHVGSSNFRLEMGNHEIDTNEKYGAAETSETTRTGKSFDDHINKCDATHDNSEEIVETCKSNACIDAISPSVIDVTNATQHCSPNLSQETSISKHVDDQMNDFDMNDCKSEEVVEDSSVKDNKPNECLNFISPLITNVDIATCETINENGLHSISQSIDDIDVRDMSYKSEGMVDSSNAIGMEPNSCLDALSPSLINLDSMTHEACKETDLSSCTMISGIEKYSEKHKVDAENNFLIISGSGPSYDVETYSNDIFTSTMEECELVKMDTSSNELKNDLESCHVLSDKDVVQNTMHAELHTSCVTPFGREHTGGMTPNTDCTPHSFSKASALEEMNKPGNELENCFHGRDAEDDSSDFIGNDGRNPLHINVATSSWIPSSGGLPMLDMIPDQCVDQLNGVGEKHTDLSDLVELRLDGTQPLEFVLLAGQESGSTPNPTDELDYVAELEVEHHRSSAQSGWDASLTTMVGGCELTAVCVWCGNEFSREPITTELESDTVRFMCSACKLKISRQLDDDLSG